MKLAIMQPYFFPYIGYWQLLSCVDKFVIYDDVNYIKKGWINRNRILVNGEAAFTTLPLAGASQNLKINEISVKFDVAARRKLVKTIEFNYKKSPFYSEMFPLFEKILMDETKNLSEYLYRHITQIAELLQIDTEIVKTSSVYGNSNLTGQQRILDICKKEHASVYINPIGGIELYDAPRFNDEKITLFFLKTIPEVYDQRANDFVPYLSIIDILMETGVAGVKSMLSSFELVKAEK